MKYKDDYIKAVAKEIKLRKSYLRDTSIQTIYFGGGTPSQLNYTDFSCLFNAINNHFDMSPCQEITLEANPDDITPAYIQSLSQLPFNRISLGIQSFHSDDLHFLNRRHSVPQAIEAVKLCQEYGFSNISVDLIYGLPKQTEDRWRKNLDELLLLDIPHISAYHLIYEEGTALYKLLETGKINTISEELSVTLFSTLIETMQKAGYLHYEISNFARTGYISQHNSSYWNGEKYLGIGPSAHSYDGVSREWNIASLPLYIEGINANHPVVEKEVLGLYTRYNDFVITRLRTMWGVDTNELATQFGEDLRSYFYTQADKFVKKGLLTQEKTFFRLSQEGIFISDSIMSDLLYV